VVALGAAFPFCPGIFETARVHAGVQILVKKLEKKLSGILRARALNVHELPTPLVGGVDSPKKIGGARILSIHNALEIVVTMALLSKGAHSAEALNSTTYVTRISGVWEPKRHSRHGFRIKRKKSLYVKVNFWEYLRGKKEKRESHQ